MAVGAARWAGALHGRRDRAARGTREERLASWTEEAVRDAWAERRRIAAGLETTVLSRTADMVAEAEAGRLDVTAERAREALAAMRALLDTVREGEAGPELRPQPTLQALDLLAHQLRATGRDVEIRLTDRVPERLPTAVDPAAYRAGVGGVGGPSTRRRTAAPGPSRAAVLSRRPGRCHGPATPVPARGRPEGPGDRVSGPGRPDVRPSGLAGQGTAVPR
ncbi:hypothetical protein [Streptomyces sp. GC420]|uniref:hypothetical protein n=1 Tax=Streptomyces sp. GC420 TaxID=2697568 RepID=UPI001FB85446|nr:hypothetical protein [Streptomyces sp. GC420]